jgi:transcriptional regulator with XRE-family HTH domain
MPTETNIDVAANLRAEIARRQLRQADLAAIWGISEMAVSRRVNGAVPLSADQTAAAAEWLGLSIADLFGP